MSAPRLLSVSLLLSALTACAGRPNETAPQPLTPEAGPKASIHVGYAGGLVNRSLTAYFRAEQNSYVVVGHMGGDGVIRILYPETPFDNSYIRAKKTLRTATVDAAHDGIPSLFSYSMSPYRSLSSLNDSYDGRGHGYVFLIASRVPLHLALLEEEGGWAEWEVADYTRSADPRYAIRDFAAAVAGRSRYTLKFASNFASTHYDAYASRAWDCALLSNMGFFAYSPWWHSWNSSLYSLRNTPANYCRGSSHPAYRYAYTHGRGIGTVLPPTTVIPGTTTPGGPAPTLNRPGRRGLPSREATENAARSSITRVGATARSGPGGGNELGARAGRTYSPRPGYGVDRSRTTYGESGSRASDRPTRTTRTSDDRPSRPRETTSTSTSSGSSSGSARSADPAPRSSDTRAVSSPREARSGRPDTP
jgi:hypothetical protein